MWDYCHATFHLFYKSLLYFDILDYKYIINTVYMC